MCFTLLKKSFLVPQQLSSSPNCVFSLTRFSSIPQPSAKLRLTVRIMSSSAKAHEQKLDSESTIRRNPHGDFKEVEASRPDYREVSEMNHTKTRKPGWQWGGGGNDGDASLTKNHVEIDPYEEGREAPSNYKLLISAIVPRPIGFCSTLSKDGTSSNLAPFSYFNVINHDPPLFIFGFSGGFDRAKDTCKNLAETGECCINIISEHYIEAANSCSINAPHGVSEWPLSGLHPASCKIVKPNRVKEAVFSIECKLVETREYESRKTPGKKTSVLAIVEGFRFWVREDAINEARDFIDPNVLRPMGRMGRVTYTRVTDLFDIPRPDWKQTNETESLEKLTKPHHEEEKL